MRVEKFAIFELKLTKIARFLKYLIQSSYFIKSKF